MPITIGETIGSYRLQEVLGRGGMGCVFSAHHVLLGRRAAVKVLWPQFAVDAEYVSRFLYEARVVNDVRHPNIVDVFDFVVTDEPRRVACVMEYLDGVSLGALLASRRLSVTQILNLTRQLIDALSAVHAVGVVHRDLKPDNIMVIGAIDGDLSERPALKILDFGIAKANEGQASHKTATGFILGTPAYMAPEQIFGERISPATDVFAIGEILFEMVAGHRLYAGDPSAVLRTKARNTRPAILLPAEVPHREELMRLIAACLEHAPEERASLADIEATLSALDGVPERKAPKPVTQAKVTAQPRSLSEVETTVGQAYRPPDDAVSVNSQRALVAPAMFSATTARILIGVGIAMILVVAAAIGYLTSAPQRIDAVIVPIPVPDPQPSASPQPAKKEETAPPQPKQQESIPGARVESSQKKPEPPPPKKVEPAPQKVEAPKKVEPPEKVEPPKKVEPRKKVEAYKKDEIPSFD